MYIDINLFGWSFGGEIPYTLTALIMILIIFKNLKELKG